MIIKKDIYRCFSERNNISRDKFFLCYFVYILVYIHTDEEYFYEHYFNLLYHRVRSLYGTMIEIILRTTMNKRSFDKIRVF